MVRQPLELAGIGQLDSSNVITIGVASSLSSPIPELGWRQANAVQLAVDQINAVGGLLIGGSTYTVVVTLADSTCSGQGAAIAAQLLGEGAVAVVGHTCSNDSISAAPVYNAQSVSMISPASTNALLTQMGYTNTFRTVHNDNSRADWLAEFLYDKGLYRAALVARPDGSGTNYPLKDEFTSKYTSLGGTVVITQYVAGVGGVSTALNAIQAEDVDVIVTSDIMGGDVAAEVSKVSYARGMTATIGWMGGGAYDSYVTLAGSQAAEGDFVSIEGRRVSDQPGFSTFADDYLAANFPNYPTGPDYADGFVPFAYDAANIILEAIDRADSTNPADIRDEIAATANFKAVVGTIQGFDANGDVAPQWGYIASVKDGEWIPAGLTPQFYPEIGGTLNLGATWGQTATVEIPPGATSEALVVTYTLVATVDYTAAPTQTVIGRYAIRLESNVSISSPMTLTVEYSDADVNGVDESTLELYVWDVGQGKWVPAAPCNGYIRDLDRNILQAVLCHFSDYVLIGETTDSSVYLPIVQK